MKAKKSVPKVSSAQRKKLVASLQSSAVSQISGSSKKPERYRIVIDTNVLIRAFYFNGKARTVLSHALRSHIVIISDYIIDEFVSFAKNTMPKTSRRDIALMRQFLEPYVHEHTSHNVVVRDINDVPILQLAVEHTAAILTGDEDILEHSHNVVPPVLSLDQYEDLFLLK